MKTLTKYFTLTMLVLITALSSKAQMNITFPEVLFTNAKSIGKGLKSEVIMNRVIELLDNAPATSSVHISIYMISHAGVISAIQRADTRGVNLHLIVDVSRSSSIDANKAALITLKATLSPNAELIEMVNDCDASAINHNKFALFSKINTTTGVAQNVTFQTSHNFITSGPVKAQDALIFNDVNLYNAYLANWNVLKSFSSSGMKNGYTYSEYNDASKGITVQFLPRRAGGAWTGADNIVENLNAITDVSNATIRLVMSDWDDSRPAVINKLMDLQTQGASIEVIAKTAAGIQTRAKLNQMKQNGAFVKIFNSTDDTQPTTEVHSKWMTIEGTWKGEANAKIVITGTHNFTFGALQTNNEILFYLKNSPLYANYLNYFNELKAVESTFNLLAWDLSASKTNDISKSSTATQGGINTSMLARGAGLAYSNINYGFGSKRLLQDASVLPSTKAAAVQNDEYFEFTASAKAGYALSLSTLDFMSRRSSSAAPKTYRWKYSLDGINFIEIGTADVNTIGITGGDFGVSQPTITLSSVAALQNVPSGTTVTFRLYFWGATTIASTFGLGAGTTDNVNILELGGSVAPSGTPPIVAWQFATSGLSNGNSKGDELTYNATTTKTGLNTPVLTRGVGITQTGLVRGFSSTPAIVTLTKAAAAVNNTYFQFEIKPKSGYAASLSQLEATLRKSSSGGSTYRWKYSLDGTNFIDIGTTDGEITDANVEGISQAPLDLSTIPALQNIAFGTTVTFRLYVWNLKTVGSGTFAIGKSGNAIDNAIAIIGTVKSANLPVTLTRFGGKNENNGIKLSWSTASETNNSHFDLMRSANGISFTKLATITGSGTTNNSTSYSYLDHSPSPGVNYYQLEQVDYDGKSERSSIIAINSGLTPTTLKVALNTDRSAVKISVYDFLGGKSSLILYDITGNKVISENVFLEKGASEFSRRVNLQKGVYVIVLKTATENKSAKFIY